MEEVRIQIERLKERIIREYNPEKIILFGSLARGDYHELSDIDMVVIKKTRRRFLERVESSYMKNKLEPKMIGI